MLKTMFLSLIVLSTLLLPHSAQTIPDKWILEQQFISKIDSYNKTITLFDPCDPSCTRCFGPKSTQCLACSSELNLNTRLLQCETSGTYGLNIAIKFITMIFIFAVILIALIVPSNSKGVFYATFLLSEFQIIDALYYIDMDKPGFLREVFRAFSICNLSLFWSGIAGIIENGESDQPSEYFNSHQNVFPYFKELGIPGAFIYRGGTAFFITLTAFLLTWVYLIAHKGFKVRVPEIVKHIFEWNLIIRIFLLFAFSLTEAVIQQLANLSFSSAYDITSVIFAFIAIIFLVFSTWIITTILRRERLQENYSQYRYKALIEELELGMDHRSHYLHLILAARRVVIAVIIAVIPQGAVQILLIMILTIAVLIFINLYYGFSDVDLLHFFVFKEGSLLVIEFCLFIVYFGGSSSWVSYVFSGFIIVWIVFTMVMGIIFVFLKNKKNEVKTRLIYTYITEKICCVYFLLLKYRKTHLEEEDDEGSRHTSYLIVESEQPL